MLADSHLWNTHFRVGLCCSLLAFVFTPTLPTTVLSMALAAAFAIAERVTAREMRFLRLAGWAPTALGQPRDTSMDHVYLAEAQREVDAICTALYDEP